MKENFSEFYTLKEYLVSEKHLNKPTTSRMLVEYLISKIVENPEIKCMIQERGNKAIIFVPVSLIKEGKAGKGMKDKNIITVWYFGSRIDIEIEDRENKEQCFLKEDINDKMIQRIHDIYKNII